MNAGTTYAGRSFRLSGDIDLGGAPWTPIGGACAFGQDGVPAGPHFDGTLDGASHTITDLAVTDPAAGTGGYGLFGYTDGATITNLCVAGSLDMGAEPVDAIGAVVGYARGGGLYNVHSSVTVHIEDASGTATMCGGVAGVVDNPSSTATTYVRYCSNSGAVTGRGRVGGIVYCVRDGGVVVDQRVDTSGAFISGESADGAARRHANVIAVLCGHYAGEYAGASVGDAGNTVYDLLTDYQDEPHGGGGWLRLYEFSPLEDKVRAVTYSPYLDEHRTDADSKFALTLAQDSHKVTFVSAGATHSGVAAASGSWIAAPPDPVRAGWAFAGWYTDAACTEPVAFPFTVGADATLHASWKRAAITVVQPRAGAVWPRPGARTVRWTVDGSPDGRRFIVKLLDAAGRTRLTRRVAAGNGVTSYATTLHLSTAVRTGVYTIEVSNGSPSSESPRLRSAPGARSASPHR